LVGALVRKSHSDLVACCKHVVDGQLAVRHACLQMPRQFDEPVGMSVNPGGALCATKSGASISRIARSSAASNASNARCTVFSLLLGPRAQGANRSHLGSRMYGPRMERHLHRQRSG
jgi:hypothetical protein